MFPTELDNAKVLYYTPRDDYGAITYPSGEVADLSITLADSLPKGTTVESIVCPSGK